MPGATPNEIPKQAAEHLLAHFGNVRETTESLVEPLTIEDCVVQSSVECSPVKWQLAHTTWFFETFLLVPHVAGYKEYHPKFGYLFNSYYNAVGDRTPRTARGLMSRPTLAEVIQYRAHVNDAMKHLIERGDESLQSLIELGINHEQQHQELIITDVKTVLAMNPLLPMYQSREIGNSGILPLTWSAFGEGVVEIGAEGSGFYFDNEGPRHRVFLQKFALADRLITNAEYKQFIADGGYVTSALWLSDGWARLLAESWQAPKYWEMHEGDWWNMTLQGFRPVEDSEPVTHISQYEADAFATWCGARLPTEFEWEIAARDIPAVGNFLDTRTFHPIPLKHAEPLAQMFGDVWEWTRSAYLPYPGFKPAPGAIGEYNGKFMSNQMVLRGGSCATPGDHIRSTYRNFFPAESRWQFSGIRVAKDV